MVPIVAALLQQGLGLLGNAILAKGKDVVEKKLGVTIPDDPMQLTSPKLVELKQAEMKHEEVLRELAIRQQENEIKAEAAGQQQVTARWQSDMTSDSWLSKNVRPMTLIYWTVAITLLVILDSLDYKFKVKNAWIELIEASYMVILAAYFIGRTVQHLGVTHAKKRAGSVST